MYAVGLLYSENSVFRDQIHTAKILMNKVLLKGNEFAIFICKSIEQGRHKGAST